MLSSTLFKNQVTHELPNKCPKLISGQSPKNDIIKDFILGDIVKGFSTNSTFSTPPTSGNFPVEDLPAHYGYIVNEVYDKHNIPPDYMALGMLCVVATVIGNRCKIKLKNNWKEPAIIYGINIGDPGSYKTQAQQICLAPIEEIDIENYSQYRTELSELEESEGNSKPHYKQIRLGDCTLESLFHVHNHNKNGLLLSMDEIMSWVKSWGRYRQGNDKEFWLQSWSQQGFPINRKGDNTIYITEPNISVFGGIQPEVLKRELAGHDMGSGFLDRILFAYPDEILANQWNEEDLDPNLTDAYRQFIRKIYKNELPETLVLSDDAKVIWKNIYNHIHDRISTTNDSKEKQILFKLVSYCARLSLIIEIMKWSTGEVDSLNSIGKASVKSAARLIRYFEYTASKVAESLTTHNVREDHYKFYKALPSDGDFKSSEMIMIADSFGIKEKNLYKTVLPKFKDAKMLYQRKNGIYNKKPLPSQI